MRPLWTLRPPYGDGTRPWPDGSATCGLECAEGFACRLRDGDLPLARRLDDEKLGMAELRQAAYEDTPAAKKLRIRLANVVGCATEKVVRGERTRGLAQCLPGQGQRLGPSSGDKNGRVHAAATCDLRQPRRVVVTMDLSLLFPSDRSSVLLLHELVHVIEPTLSSAFEEELAGVRRKEREAIEIAPAVVVRAVDEERPAECTAEWRAAAFNYATLEREFLALAIEAWFAASPDETLRACGDVVSLRVARNRAELFAVYPRTARLLAKYLSRYSWDNLEVDAAAVDGGCPLPH